MPSNIRQLFIGRPLETAQAAHEKLSNQSALAVFASDALSSSAYATDEILMALALAGASTTMGYPIPIGIAIVVLVALVAFSYRQVVYAYPRGGGSYAVAQDNLGELSGQVVGASLLVDYVLTVAVSVASGVAAITSAFPILFPYRITLGAVCILLVTWANLRGARESARVFMIPSYGFILCIGAMICIGLGRWVTGQGPVEPLALESDVKPMMDDVTVFLILRAFASGCAALTGIEAVSDGVTAFKEPVSKNASKVLTWLASILAFLFLGITILAHYYQVMPVLHETVVSQIARATFGRSTMYYVIQFFTAIILILAANTSFNGFPRLASVQAEDGYLPRQLANLGDRLVFANGIIALGFGSAILLVIFKGDTHKLIPLYAVGVFLSFTMAQAGLVKHWFKIKDIEPAWRFRAIVNGLGALVTGIVTLVIAYTKFLHGAWIVLVIIPILVVVFLQIKRHYREVSAALTLEGATQPDNSRNLVLVLVGSFHRGMLEAVQYARSLAHENDNVRGIHLETESDRPRKSLVEAWDHFGLGIPLHVVKAPYRSLVEPLVKYIDQVREDEGFDTVTLVLPEFVVRRWWEQLLHNQTALLLQFALHGKPHVVIANYRYYLSELGKRQHKAKSKEPAES